jgi:hypothetical protein
MGDGPSGLCRKFPRCRRISFSLIVRSGCFKINSPTQRRIHWDESIVTLNGVKTTWSRRRKDFCQYASGCVSVWLRSRYCGPVFSAGNITAEALGFTPEPPSSKSLLPGAFFSLVIESRRQLYWCRLKSITFSVTGCNLRKCNAVIEPLNAKQNPSLQIPGKGKIKRAATTKNLWSFAMVFCSVLYVQA